VLQGTVCSDCPVQLAPPLAGAGLLQVRVWLRVPPPHAAVHLVLLTHSDQLPSTGAKAKHIQQCCSLLSTQVRGSVTHLGQAGTDPCCRERSVRIVRCSWRRHWQGRG
jgi:hypothetical protein